MPFDIAFHDNWYPHDKFCKKYGKKEKGKQDNYEKVVAISNKYMSE